MKIYKKILVPALCAALALSFAGCRQAEPEPEPVENTIMVEGSSKPSESGAGRDAGRFIYAAANPVVAGLFSSDALPFYNYVKISGLSDGPLQDSVNYMVQDMTKALASSTLPPYESLKGYSDEDLGAATLDVSSDLVFSCNDILSFTATKLFGTASFSCCEFDSLNFDLRTQKELVLSDLFEEGYDYKAVIDPVVKDAAADGTYTVLCEGTEDVDDSVTLGPSFEGVGDGTKFYIDRNGIQIVFDYSTPGVVFSGSRPIAVTVGFAALSDGLLLSGGCDSRLYTDPDAAYTVLIPQNGGDEVVYENSEDLGLENLMISDSYSYPADAPRAVASAIDAFFDEHVPDEDSMLSRAKRSPADWLLWSRSAVCTRLGDYYVLVCELTDNISNSYWEVLKAQYVFDASGRRLGLGDVFAPGVDYEDLILRKLSDTLSKNYSRYTLPEGTDAQSLYDVGLSLRLGYDALYLESEPLLLTTEDSEGKELSFMNTVSVTLNYRDFKKGEITVLP